MNHDIQILPLSSTSFTEKEYFSFLQEYYVDRADYKYNSQIRWYRNNQYYLVVVAVVDGNLAGQTTAYSCEAYFAGEIQNISWSCDTFVLHQYRGLGLGKGLQKYLHEHTVNFSSAGYTPLNGIIKRKCGAKELFENSFIYYPVSNLFNFGIRKLLLKYLKKDYKIKSCDFPLYYYLNYRKSKGFDIKVELSGNIPEEIFPFIENTLRLQYDFYVKRDRGYMQWKYKDNPTMTYKLLTVKRNGLLVATVFFTDVFEYKLSEVTLRYCKILDSIIAPNMAFTQRDALLEIMRYFQSHSLKVDGIASMMNVGYIGKIGFKRSMLSTYERKKITSPYMAYSDQDLEQMM